MVRTSQKIGSSLCAALCTSVLSHRLRLYVEYSSESSHSETLTNLPTEQFFFVIFLCQLHWAQTTQGEVGRDGTSNFPSSCPPLSTHAHKP